MVQVVGRGQAAGHEGSVIIVRVGEIGRCTADQALSLGQSQVSLSQARLFQVGQPVSEDLASRAVPHLLTAGHSTSAGGVSFSTRQHGHGVGGLGRVEGGMRHGRIPGICPL